VSAGLRGMWRASKTPAGMPGPTGAQNKANTNMTGPPGKWLAAANSRATPTLPANKVGSNAADGENISNPLATSH
jgi:hypothetical protein